MSLTIRVSDFQQQYDAIRAVRTEVFLVEQAIPPELEYDQHDLTSIHVVVYDHQKPVGTGRLDVHQSGRIGRVAVLKSFRRQGIGRQIMTTLEQQAVEIGLNQIWFHSQITAVPFYRALGYESEGEIFMEANIPHVAMRKKLEKNSAN